MVNIKGTSGPDDLQGTNSGDDIRGIDGYWNWLGVFTPFGTDTAPDILRGLGGNDELYGYGGDDELWGGSGNDKLYGGSGRDRLHGGGDRDKIYGEAGNDTLLFLDGEDAVNNEIFNGGSDFDTILLENNSWAADKTFDLTAADIVSIERIWFKSEGTVLLGAGQINYPSAGLVSGISHNLVVRGHDVAGHTEEIIIILSNQDNMLDMSSWQFVNWGGQGERIEVQGGNFVAKIHDSAATDIITDGTEGSEIRAGRGGIDEYYGYAGNDLFIYRDQNFTAPAGTIIDGGLHDDTVASSDVTADLRNVAFTSIEKLGLYRQGTLILNAEQIGNGLASNLLLHGDWSSFPALLQIHMDTETTLDISSFVIHSSWRPNTDGDLIYIAGDADGENITGSSTKDLITGGGGNDTIFGRGGRDTLEGGDGIDTIDGGQGDDVIEGGPLGDTLRGRSGNDTFVYENGEGAPLGEQVNGGIGTDVLRFYNFVAASDTTFDMRQASLSNLEGIEFASRGTVMFTASQIKNAFTAALTVDGHDAAGHTEVVQVYMQDETLLNLSPWTFTNWNPLFQQDMIEVYGDSDSETIAGTSQADLLVGAGGQDQLSGGNGDDTLHGGNGNDTLDGGSGDDAFLYKGGETGNAGETVNGSTGNDSIVIEATASAKVVDIRGISFSSIEKLEFSNGATALIDSSLPLASTKLTVDGVNASNQQEVIDITVGATTHLDISGWSFLNWGQQDDHLIIRGDGDDETIIGSIKKDIIHGGGGLDSLSGGAGNDIFVFDSSSSPKNGTVVDGGSGTNALRFEQGAGSQNIDLREVNFSHIDRLVFAADAVAVFNASQLLSPVSFATALSLEGTTGKEQGEVQVHTGTLTTVDLSSWTFNTWDPDNSFVRLVGDAQNERLTGTSMRDIIHGNAGSDLIKGGDGNDGIYGGSENDTIYGENGNDLLRGEGNDDTIRGGSGADIIYGDTGGDTLFGDIGSDTIYGGGGVDVIHGGIGADTIHGGTSGDTIYGDDHDDTIYGNSGDDIIYGGDGVDTIDGGKHVDEIYGNAGNDILKGGGGGDTIDGGLNNDTIHGNSGHDVLKGGGGADTIYGNTGSDDLFGNIGDDTLHGGWGYDDMWGGGGVDTFVFKKRDWADRVKDFEDDVDIIDLTDWGFASVADALSYATEINGHVKFDFSSLPGAGSKDYLWVENITIAALQDDILV